MPTPNEHALLSASSAERWLHCTAAPRYEEQFPENTSDYAEEGKLAHAVCELYARKKFSPMSTRKFNTELKKLKEAPIFQEEMLTTAEAYVQYLTEKAMTYEHMPYVALEVRVDFSEYVKDGFGTCDCVMIGGDTLHITDYKHGKGVSVSSTNNPQMRLYALGALHQYMPIYGDTIKHVTMGICQPRLYTEVQEDRMTVDELLAWGEEIKPISQIAFSGLGTFVPGDWCRFCRGRVKCRKRAEQYTALEDFKDCVIEGKMTANDAHLITSAIMDENTPVSKLPKILTDADIGDLLVRGAALKTWLKDLEDYATETLLRGGSIPGWKIVAGKSNRAFRDNEKALRIILEAGYEKDKLYEPKSLAELEKVIGKKPFAELLGEEIYKPIGKPTLAAVNDPRPVYNSAAADFKEVSNNGN